jgi:hypothetical protein
MIYVIKEEIEFIEIIKMLLNNIDFQIKVLLYQVNEAIDYNQEIELFH